MGAKRKERPQQVVCYKAWDKTEELELEDRKEREDCLSDSLSSVARVFPGRKCVALFNCGLGYG